MVTWFFLAAAVPAQNPPRQQPEPIVIRRTGGPPTIPDVPRDRVIGFALYTVQNGVIKLSAQLYPLRPGEERQVALEVEADGSWKTIARTRLTRRAGLPLSAWKTGTPAGTSVTG
jgi:hypothetical protein